MLGVAVGLRLRLLRDEVARLHVVTHQRVGAHLVRVRGRVRVRVRTRRAPARHRRIGRERSGWAGRG